LEGFGGYFDDLMKFVHLILDQEVRVLFEFELSSCNLDPLFFSVFFNKENEALLYLDAGRSMG
jgi:hypothetical protein